jgi:hypothetical protein
MVCGIGLPYRLRRIKVCPLLDDNYFGLFRAFGDLSWTKTTEAAIWCHLVQENQDKVFLSEIFGLVF